MSEFDHWLFSSLPGDNHIYHTGFLARDRWVTNPFYVADMIVARGIGREPTNTNARHAMRAWDDGLVHLKQRKCDEGIYEYIAERRPNRRMT